MASMRGRPTREELEQEIAALEEEMREREAALPIHSVRPAQFEAIEELGEQIREKRELLKEAKAMLEVLRPKLRAKRKGAPDTEKGMGISG